MINEAIKILLKNLNEKILFSKIASVGKSKKRKNEVSFIKRDEKRNSTVI
ncbi:hypothetical protein LBMAG33_1440 [Candidatus Levyibacteriota bacterium]|nr:hypothetical protein LBMAG33_1440 [Candidatus Levybacteria bacterium]